MFYSGIFDKTFLALAGHFSKEYFINKISLFYRVLCAAESP